VIDSHRFCPLPKDFAEAAVSWRRRFVQENGYAYGSDRTVKAEVGPCSDCYDTGYIFCHLSPAHPETLCFCYCDIGADKELNFKPAYSRMPRWEKNRFDKYYGFVKLDFPLEKFKPADPNAAIQQIAKKEANAIVEWWQGQKREAHKWWQGHLNSIEKETRSST